MGSARGPDVGMHGSEPAAGAVAGKVAAALDAVSLKERELAHAAQVNDGGSNPRAAAGRKDLRPSGMMLGFQDGVGVDVGGERCARESHQGLRSGGGVGCEAIQTRSSYL